MNKQHYPVVILGAGVTGLTIAHYLNKQNKDFLVLEKLDRHGGVIYTRSNKGFVYESGPNSGVISHPEVVSLFDDLGDAIKLEKGNDFAKIRYVLKGGEWRALPTGPISAITTPLFSFKDKLRVLGEPFRAKGVDPNETLASFVKRRLGNSFLDYAVDPFILGIYAGDPSMLIPRHALPKLYNLEQDYGSFIKGTIQKSKLPKTPLEKRTDRAVFSLEGGLSRLTDALYNSAGQDRFQFGVDDMVVQPHDNGYVINYTKEGQKHQVYADSVISTFGSVGLSEVFPFIGKEDIDHLTNLKYARVVEIALGFDQWKGCPLNGFGGLIPHKEKRGLLGVLFMSTLFKGRAPEGGALLSVFMGGVRNEQLCDLNDDEIMKVLAKEMKDIMKLDKFDPSMVEIMRYSHAIPQYGINSDERFAAIDRVQKNHKGLIIAGNLRGGIGMADRIRQGTQIAESLGL